ncbi:MAG: YigZ family protein [Rhodothermales bacterium]
MIPPDPDTFRTIGRPALAEPPKTKGSRFIGEAFPAATEAEAEAHLDAVRKREHAATHWCWAWRLGREGDTFRSGDDGEPSGSAGAPILRQIDARELTNTVVVVTRYYGGTKLGVGGLVRAYGEAASAVLDAARIVERVIRVAVRLRFAYDDTSPAMHTVSRFDAEIAEQHYTDDTELVVRVRRSEAEALQTAFVDALGGRGTVTLDGS